MTKQELVKIRDWFIRGAEICKKAGLDGIELHGAHTFFLNRINHPNDIVGNADPGNIIKMKKSKIPT